jgi:uncharacterized protein YbjQ (UPF0145 family)
MTAPRVLSAEELEAIAGGALPSAARRRLEELAGLDGVSSSFLSAQDDSLAAGLGVLVMGQVVGCAAGGLRAGVVRAVGPGSGARHKPGEPRWLERSGIVETWTGARLRAVSRIQDQAAILGADAVVGVRASRRQLEAVAEVVLTGTAVRIGRTGSSGAGRPLVTATSLAQLTKLRACGAEPLGLVGGCASVAALPSTATGRALRRRRRARRSRELDEFSFAFGETRRRAVDRLRREAAGLGAGGVIGVDFDDLAAFRGGGGDYHVVLHLLGTAVRGDPAGPRGQLGVTLRTGPNAR